VNGFVINDVLKQRLKIYCCNLQA